MVLARCTRPISGNVSRYPIGDTATNLCYQRLHKALLGRPAINALKIIQQVEPVQAFNAVTQFPELFAGLGKLTDNYTIKLADDAKPFALTTPRRVAVPLLPKVK